MSKTNVKENIYYVNICKHDKAMVQDCAED